MDTDLDKIEVFASSLTNGELMILERITGTSFGDEDASALGQARGMAYLAAKRLGHADITLEDIDHITPTESMRIVEAAASKMVANRPANLQALIDSLPPLGE